MRQIRLELGMLKRTSVAHPIPAGGTQLIALMAAAINAVLKGELDEESEQEEAQDRAEAAAQQNAVSACNGDCLDGGSQRDSSDIQHGLAR